MKFLLVITIFFMFPSMVLAEDNMVSKQDIVKMQEINQKIDQELGRRKGVLTNLAEKVSSIESPKLASIAAQIQLVISNNSVLQSKAARESDLVSLQADFDDLNKGYNYYGFLLARSSVQASIYGLEQAVDEQEQIMKLFPQTILDQKTKSDLDYQLGAVRSKYKSAQNYLDSAVSTTFPNNKYLFTYAKTEILSAFGGVKAVNLKLNQLNPEASSGASQSLF